MGFTLKKRLAFVFQDANGAMGIKDGVKIQKTPIAVDLKEKIVKITSGNDHIAALSDKGEVYTFGML